MTAPPSAIVGVSFQDLMNALTAYTEALGYPLNSATFLPQAGNGCVLSGIDLRVAMGMFEEELTPIIAAILDLTDSRNDAEHLAPLPSLDDFS